LETIQDGYKNLPADVVDKVQVFDKKSDQSQFTGIDDGNSEKTSIFPSNRKRKMVRSECLLRLAVLTTVIRETSITTNSKGISNFLH
jgi:hypothetical protein